MLISHTPNPIELITQVATISTGKSAKKGLIYRLADMGHMTPFEHVSFTFKITDITRKTSHQLVRYRHASIVQESMRYVDFSDRQARIPEIGKASQKLKEYAQEIYSATANKDEARNALPIGTLTQMYFTCNLAELIHIAKQRLCMSAEREIRNVVKKMCSEVAQKFPELEPLFQPKCVYIGRCNEPQVKCGIMPYKELNLKQKVYKLLK